MPALVTTEANRLLDASLGVASYTAPTGSMKLALATSSSSAATAGTEVTGGSYARQNIVFGSASAGSTSNTGAVTYTNMPTATVTNVDVYDSNGTPRRAYFGPLTVSKSTVLGDTLSFAISSITISLS